MSGTHPTPDRDRRAALRRRARRALVTGLLTLAIGVLVAACGGGGGSSVTTSVPDTTAPVPVIVATDPAVPVTVEAGHRFSVVLPADPGEGWRWVVQPFDTARLVALGSEFSDDEQRRMASTVATSTTTTAPAGRPPATGQTGPTVPVDPAASTTTTTAMPPLVQIVSFAGRAPGTATVSFRATQIVPTPDAKPTVVSWTVEITAPAPSPR